MRNSRVLRLEEPPHDGVVHFLTALPAPPDSGKRESWVTVTRTGAFSDPRYGKFEITPKMLTSMVANFEGKVFGQDIFIDVSHQPALGSAGTIKQLQVDTSKLRALVEWTDLGIKAVREQGFKYLSAEYSEDWKDNEKRIAHGALLLGAGLTIRPVIKRLDPVILQLAEGKGEAPVLVDPPLQIQLSTETRTMWKSLLEKLLANLKALKLGDTVCKQLCEAADKAVGTITDETAATALIATFEIAGKQLAEQFGQTSIKLDFSGMPVGSAGLNADQVKALLADETKKLTEATAATAAKLEGNRKLLADTITAAKDVDDATKKKLTEDVAELITAELTPDQIKRLAEHQLKHAGEVIAAKKLAGMGWAPSGQVHLEQGAVGEIKALQELFDTRLGLPAQAASKRFERTGKLQDENKKLAEDVLQLYDQRNGNRLMAEHKALAGGTGTISDVALPAIFERTVIREALYDLISLQFMDVGTQIFAEPVQIPYSFRDTTGAGINSLRKYEGQGISRSGVKQSYEAAYPLPQKLAFLVSDELRLLTSNGQLDWNAVSENINNAARIVAEDIERTNFNEIVDASDTFSTVNVVAEATAAGNAANTIFVLDKFPVVRPKKVYDLKGVQVGATLYPITITVAAAAKVEYDGTNTQAAGLYWSMNYNLGEISFVSELGVLTAVANAAAIVATYTYSTNAATWDSDLGTDLLDDHWDKFLYRFGLRKSVIEDQRYHSVDFSIMSGTLRSAAEQAKQFGMFTGRAGTALLSDGNLGRIKDVPGFKSTAPGLLIGDTRVVVGKRGISRFRVLKPWAMEALENARDANGLFTAQKEAYGTQWIAVCTPTPLKGAYSSLIVYSATGRVDRVL
jgi:Mu-like prophage I protein